MMSYHFGTSTRHLCQPFRFFRYLHGALRHNGVCVRDLAVLWLRGDEAVSTSACAAAMRPFITGPETHRAGLRKEVLTYETACEAHDNVWVIIRGCLAYLSFSRGALAFLVFSTTNLSIPALPSSSVTIPFNSLQPLPQPTEPSQWVSAAPSKTTTPATRVHLHHLATLSTTSTLKNSTIGSSTCANKRRRRRRSEVG
jgi:hypothetical protein